jgi:hypothetical protein
MKYLSVLVFAILLAWTWNMIHREATISFETHAGIQEKLAQLIQQTILSKKPEASDIRIHKIWTEPETATKVLAHFIYSFQEPDTNGKSLTNQIQGEGVLEKQPDDGSGLDRWSLTQVKATSDAVTFEEGLIVTPGEEPAAESPVANPTPETK